MVAQPQALGPQVTVYRLFDLADEVDLDRLAGERLRLLRGRGGAVKFDRPPASLDLGVHRVAGRDGQLSARVYDFGVCALRWHVGLGERLPWTELADRTDELAACEALEPFFEEQVARLERLIAPALIHPAERRISERFLVIHLRSSEPAGPAEDLLDRQETAALVLGERAPLTDGVHRDLVRYAFAYSRADLAVLGFDRVLIVDPEGIWDVADLVELAHAELIELSFYDRVLREEIEALPRLLARRAPLRFRDHGRLRRRLMARHAEITEVRSRLRGALTITEDLFYAKIHRSAMALYGATEIAEALEARLRVLSDTYGMLTGEANARRAEVLEAGIFLLVLIEVLRAFW